MKFTAEVSETETNFLDTTVYKGKRFKTESMLDVPTETFQYTHFSACRPSGVKRGFIKGEALRLLRTKYYLKRASQTSNHFFLREDTQITEIKQPSQNLLLKTEIKPLTKTKHENRALCNAISPSSAELKTNNHEQLAFYKAATIA